MFMKHINILYVHKMSGALVKNPRKLLVKTEKTAKERIKGSTKKQYLIGKKSLVEFLKR